VAKPKKDADRRAVVEQMRREQQRKERRQGLLIIGSAVLVGAIILGFAGWQIWKAGEDGGSSQLASIGVAAGEAGCQDIEVEDAVAGANDHRNEGERILYETTPPAAGPHWGNFLQGNQIRPFWNSDDRPPVERLVHSLEHGHTILWYDETIAEDDEALEQVEEIAEAAANSDDARGKFMAAPWSSEDGGEFPEGTHLALTHWSIGGDGDPSGSQQGIWQYCDAVSGDVVEDFIAEYPSSDSPEANAP
jgi:Protein of unknown function (DUF3105)